MSKFQIWRLVTGLGFFGVPSFGWLMTLYMMVQFIPKYENDPFPSGPAGAHSGNVADVVWSLLFGALILLPLSYFLKILVLSGSLFFMLIYLWSKRNPSSPCRFYMFNVEAQYLPWVMLAFSFIVGDDIVADLLGLGVGHLFYFLKQELPHLDTPLKNMSWLQLRTPSFLYRWLQQNPTDVPAGQMRYAAAAGAGGAPARPAAPAGGHVWGQGQRLGR